eukprot:2914102-Prymnesium_polylepis.1
MGWSRSLVDRRAREHPVSSDRLPDQKGAVGQEGESLRRGLSPDEPHAVCLCPRKRRGAVGHSVREIARRSHRCALREVEPVVEDEEIACRKEPVPCKLLCDKVCSRPGAQPAH